MTSGSAKTFDHQIPGGQYSNLLVQCKSMGLWSRWPEVLNTYRDVNRLCGDIIKVIFLFFSFFSFGYICH